MRFIDTNILLYAVSRLPEEVTKKAVAHGILDRADCALSVQVLMEFYAQSTRMTRIGALTHLEATGVISVWQRFPVQAQTIDVLDRALILRERHGLSIWDSSVVAAANLLRCEEVMTEDMQHGQVIDGVRIISPFV